MVEHHHQAAVPEPVPEPGKNLAGLAGRVERGQQAAEVFADDIEAGSLPPIRRIRRELRIGQPAAQDAQAYLRTLIRTP